uniref:RING-type domain-containing protein n=1 Tax=Stomoxys calcitrans TaxID=35570 RepID=A0A1I8PI76_STOCA
MFPLHCNKCFCRQKFETNRLFHISRCGHVICKECLQSTCPLCSKPYNGIAIQKDMPVSMQEYFEDPIKRYLHYQKVMRFHYEQERMLVIHWTNENNTVMKRLEQEIQAYNKLQKTLEERVECERTRVRKLKEYIAYHERRMEQARYMTPPITAQPRFRYPPRSKSSDGSGGNAMDVAPANCIPQLTQTIRAHYAPPRSPTLSNNNSSTCEVIAPREMLPKLKSRTPPPMMPRTEHGKKYKLNHSFSNFNI